VSVNPGWKFGIQTSTPGTLTSIPGKETTVFTWIPTPVPPTAQETQIANLTTRATSAEAISDSLDKQLATANSQITTMTAELATANGKVTSMTSQLATANEQIAALTKQIATVESTLQSTGATGTTAPETASTPVA
jgi:peptidoglycan hydrolase CwlO-like protein